MATFLQLTVRDTPHATPKNRAFGEPEHPKNGLALPPLHEIWRASAPQSPSSLARAMAETS